MLPFKRFIIEQDGTQADEGEKLKHIEHLEDHPINDGKKGFEHSIGALTQVHHHIISGSKDSSLAMKHDGSPSIVYGHHPETGKFFVASKSAFNKTPKINYTEADIQKNHGHAPGLVEKLKHALQHLPKISPKQGVFQGDVLFSGKDKQSVGDKVQFKPNTITYSAHEDSTDGKQIKRAKFGIYNHTEYIGNDAKSMTANYSPDLSSFKTHNDVYHRLPGHDTSQVKMQGKDHLEYAKEVAAAQKIHDKHGDYMYDAVEGSIKDHIKTYINSTVDTQEIPNVKGLQDHLEKKYTKEIDKRKTEAGKKKYQDELGAMIKHTNLHKQNLENVFKVHHHLQGAKDSLVKVMSQHTGGLDHEIKGQKVKPEGFVVNHEGKLSKLNDRNEFNRLNRLART